jgi:hypothetical protein
MAPLKSVRHTLAGEIAESSLPLHPPMKWWAVPAATWKTRSRHGAAEPFNFRQGSFELGIGLGVLASRSQDEFFAGAQDNGPAAAVEALDRAARDRGDGHQVASGLDTDTLHVTSSLDIDCVRHFILKCKTRGPIVGPLS